MLTVKFINFLLDLDEQIFFHYRINFNRYFPRDSFIQCYIYATYFLYAYRLL